MGSFNASLKAIGDTRGLPATVELHEGRLAIKAGEAEIGEWSLDEIGLEPTPTGYKLAAEGDQILLDMSDSERFTEELEESTQHGRKKKRSLFSRKEKKQEPESEPAPQRSIEPDPPPDRDQTVSRIPASVTRATTATEPAPRVEPEAARSPEPAKADDRGDSPSVSNSLVAMLDRTIEVTEKRWGPLLPNWVFNRIVFVLGLILVILAFVFRGVTSVVLLVTGVIALMVGGAAYTDDVMASKLLPGRTTPTHLLIVGVVLLGVGIGFGFIA